MNQFYILAFFYCEKELEEEILALKMGLAPWSLLGVETLEDCDGFGDPWTQREYLLAYHLLRILERDN